MLAQNFMSHVDLGISEPEQQALVKVLGMLEREEIADAPTSFARKTAIMRESPTLFDIGFCLCGDRLRNGSVHLGMGAARFR